MTTMVGDGDGDGDDDGFLLLPLLPLLLCMGFVFVRVRGSRCRALPAHPRPPQCKMGVGPPPKHKMLRGSLKEFHTTPRTAQVPRSFGSPEAE